MKMFDVGKFGMIGLPYSENNYDDMFSRFDTIPACHGQTDRIAILISYVSVLTRDKNERFQSVQTFYRDILEVV